MKFILVAMALALVFLIESKAQSDTLVIYLKNNQVEKISLSEIRGFQFEEVTSIGEQQKQLKALAVKGNYPNPFRDQTSIEFEIASYGDVKVVIYDNSGNQIQILKYDNCQAGKNALLWNCLDKNNNKVQSGVYCYTVKFGNEVQSKKMILAK